MFSNQELYSSLSWAQLGIGLLFGFIPVVVTIAMRRWRRDQSAGGDHDVRFKQPEQNPAGATNQEENGARAVLKLSTLLKACYYLLGVLSARREPVLFWTAVHETQAVQRLHENSGVLSAWEIRMALERLHEQDFVRADHEGFAVTESGRALYARIARLAGASILEGVERAGNDLGATRPKEREHVAETTRGRTLLLRRPRRRSRLRSRR